MKVMVLVKACKQSETGLMPVRQKMEEMGRFNDELVQAGIMKVAEGLKPSSAGVRVHFSGKERVVTDGPFTETKELVAGYWIWEVKSMEEAIAWVKRCPNPMTEDSDIEIRPIYSREDVEEMMKAESSS
jgi:PhnB protein